MGVKVWKFRLYLSNMAKIKSHAFSPLETQMVCWPHIKEVLKLSHLSVDLLKISHMKFLSEWAKFILRCSNKIAFIIIFLIIYVPKVSMGHKRKLRKQKWLSPIDCNSHAPSADTRDVKKCIKKTFAILYPFGNTEKTQPVDLVIVPPDHKFGYSYIHTDFFTTPWSIIY